MLRDHPSGDYRRFARIDRHLREQNRGRVALCGIELRSPQPFTFDGFGRFNEGYRALLAEWGIADQRVPGVGGAG